MQGGVSLAMPMLAVKADSREQGKMRQLIQRDLRVTSYKLIFPGCSATFPSGADQAGEAYDQRQSEAFA
jgi:hypothetical protein